jgi:hypothetical protein
MNVRAAQLYSLADLATDGFPQIFLITGFMRKRGNNRVPHAVHYGEEKTDVTSFKASGRGLRRFYRSCVGRVPTGNHWELAQSFHFAVNSYSIFIDRGLCWCWLRDCDERAGRH